MTKYCDGPTPYEITVQGRLDGSWSEWFGNLTITDTQEGNSIISGCVDQAALHGILRRIRDLAIPLLSVNRCIQPGGKNELD